MTQEKVEWLKRELAVLASDASAQIEHLRRLDLTECVDELALSYDAIARALTFMLQRGELNQSQCECATALNSLLDKMSGPAHAHLWTSDALRFSEEWKEVRSKASECLRLFQ